MTLEISPFVVGSLIDLFHYLFVPTHLFWIYEFAIVYPLSTESSFWLAHLGLVTSYGDVDLGQYWIGSDNDLLPGGTRPLSEPMMTYHHWEKFCRKCLKLRKWNHRHFVPASMCWTECRLSTMITLLLRSKFMMHILITVCCIRFCMRMPCSTLKISQIYQSSINLVKFTA